MAKNPFKKPSGSGPELKRNNFDLSRQNNLSLSFGKLYPVFVQEVIPGDSFSIDAGLSLNLQPMVFPVQTRMQANLHFFYCRNRSVWKNWKDFQFKTRDDIEFPYIRQSDPAFFSTGSLSDYLGLPTTSLPTSVNGAASYTTAFPPSVTTSGTTNLFDVPFSDLVSYSDSNNFCYYDENLNLQHSPYLSDFASFIPFFLPLSQINGVPFPYGHLVSQSAPQQPTSIPLTAIYYKLTDSGFIPIPTHVYNSVGSFHLFSEGTRVFSVENLLPTTFTLSEYTDFIIALARDNNTTIDRLFVAFRFINPASNPISLYSVQLGSVDPSSGSLSYDFLATNLSSPFMLQSDGTIEQPISALPFRHYEAIYNTFYRNQTVDPFVKVDPNTGLEYNAYNEWNTTIDDGADSTYYDFFYRRWQDDQFTTAQLTPQQGPIPLVGVNSNGTFTFEDSQGQQFELHAVVGSDGHTLTGIDAVDPGVPVGALQNLMSSINHGISINDFRNVNALQRWAETNLRRGYKYRDLVKAHYGVDVHYNELDMPEFIGGMSEYISTKKVVNTNAVSSDVPLGEFAGMADLFSATKHSVNKYCDESGYIIGILCVTPEPVYESVLPKHWLKKDALDYYSVEFSKIGMQPIFYNELSPVISSYEGKLNQLFGYQKAWYDYQIANDEVHGDMRTSLNDFIMMRRFGSSPELGHDFISVDPTTLNNVFADTTNNDKIYGSIYFQVYAKRPIPINAIPALE